MVHRVLHRLLELQLDFVQTTDVVPGRRGYLHDSLTKRGRVRGTESETEVLHGDTEGVKDLSIDGVFVQVNKVHLLTDLLHCSL